MASLKKMLLPVRLRRLVRGWTLAFQARKRVSERLSALDPATFKPMELTLDPAIFADVTARSVRAFSTLADIQNADYFNNLGDYTVRGRIFDRHSGLDRNFRKQFHLCPPALYILQYLAESGNRKPRTLVDYGCGLGNFMGYAVIVAPDTMFAGVDNFEQISREHVEQYQRDTFKLPVDTKAPDGEIDWVISTGVPQSWIWPSIRAMKPSRYIFETITLDDIGLFDPDYRIEFHNQFIVSVVPV